MKSSVSNVRSRETIQEKLPISSPFLILTTVGALLLGGVLAALNPVWSAVAIGFITMAAIVVLRWDELAVTAVIAVHLYVDWYFGLHLVGLAMALALLVIYYLWRSPQCPWAEPRPIWLWALFLVLAIYPAIHGALTLYDAASYYPSDVLGALMMFWLGTIIARDIASLRLLIKIFSGFAALLAVHTVVQATTGTFLFESAKISTLLASVSNYQFGGANRVGSFFINPDWNSTFLAMMIFLPLGLFVESRSLLEKILYLAEMCLMLPALLFTYNTGAWIGAAAGVLAFVVFVGRMRYRVLFALFIFVVVIVMMVAFPSQIALLLHHATGPNELSLRIGAWQTAINVIYAFPLTGVGLGLQSYLLRADPYRVPAQFLPLSQPHNSYLEWGAMAGLPVLIVFLALLACASWQAWRNWLLVDRRIRPLLSGGIAAVVVLSINSLSINGWTLPPNAAVGWLLLGALSSPLIAKSQSHSGNEEGSELAQKEK